MCQAIKYEHDPLSLELILSSLIKVASTAMALHPNESFSEGGLEKGLAKPDIFLEISPFHFKYCGCQELLELEGATKA